jgi:hypothetical protein
MAYKERTGKERGMEEGNEERKGGGRPAGWESMRMVRVERKKEERREKWGRIKLERVEVGVAEVCMINLSESWELIPGRQIRGEERPV